MPSRTSRDLVVVCAYTLDRWADMVSGLAFVRAQEPPADEVIFAVDHDATLLTDVAPIPLPDRSA